VAYQLLMGQHSEAADTLEHAGQAKAALLIKAVELGGGFAKESVIQRHEPNKQIVKSEPLKTF
jgi:hypothetical protein